MIGTVDFCYALGSRYSYLAATQIERIKRDTGAVFNWLLFQSSLLVARKGKDLFVGEPLSGQYDWNYRQQDGETWATFYGVPFRDPIGRLKFDQELAAVAALAAREQDAVANMSRGIFRMIFEDDSESLGGDDYIALAAEQGLDPDAFAADLKSDALRTENLAIIEEAAARGALVPTFFVGDRTRSGVSDRLPLVEAAIQGRI